MTIVDLEIHIKSSIPGYWSKTLELWSKTLLLEVIALKTLRTVLFVHHDLKKW